MGAELTYCLFAFRLQTAYFQQYTLPFTPLLRISSGELLEKNLPPFLLPKSPAVGGILFSAYFIPLTGFFETFLNHVWIRKEGRKLDEERRGHRGGK